MVDMCDLSKSLGLLDRTSYPTILQFDAEIEVEQHHYKGLKRLFLDVGMLYFNRCEEILSGVEGGHVRRRYPFYKVLRKIYDNRGQAIKGEPIDLTLD